MQLLNHINVPRSQYQIQINSSVLLMKTLMKAQVLVRNFLIVQKILKKHQIAQNILLKAKETKKLKLA